MTQTAIVSQKGWIVIPAQMRKVFGIMPKTKISISTREDGILLKPMSKNIISETFGAYASLPPLKELLKEKYADNKLEEKREERLLNI